MTKVPIPVIRISGKEGDGVARVASEAAKVMAEVIRGRVDVLTLKPE